MDTATGRRHPAGALLETTASWSAMAVRPTCIYAGQMEELPDDALWAGPIEAPE